MVTILQLYFWGKGGKSFSFLLYKEKKEEFKKGVKDEIFGNLYNFFIKFVYNFFKAKAF